MLSGVFYETCEIVGRILDNFMIQEKFFRTMRAVRWLVGGTPAQKRRVRQELARASAGIFGDFPISEDHKAWRKDKVFLDDYRRLSPGNAYSQDRKWVLREYVRLSNELPGDLAECGSFEGASAFFMCQASTHGILCVFDSFEGISEPDVVDTSTAPNVTQWSKGDMLSSEAQLRANLAHVASVRVFAGWIPKRFDEVQERKFRVVHVDVDLYQPTRDSLEFFYPRLSDGGVIIMDDYGFLTCPGAKLAADEFAQLNLIQILHLPTGQGVITKRPS